MADVPVLASSSPGHPLADAGLRQAFEHRVLGPFLGRQRWFAGKARRIATTRLADWSTAPDPDTPVLTMVEVAFVDGGTDRYFLPLAFVSEPASGEPTVLARIEGARAGFLVDALADDGACRALAGAMLEERALAMHDGTTVPAAYVRDAVAPRSGRIVRSTAEQSNSCVIFDDRFVLKLLRHLEPGPNPELEISRFLAGRFPHVPPLVAALEYKDAGPEATSLAMLQGFVPNQGTGWERAVADSRRFVTSGAAEALGTDFVPLAATLGRRTAELHLALAVGSEDAAFSPERFTVVDAVTLAQHTQRDARRTLAALSDRMDSLPEAARPHARAVLATRERLLARILAVASGSARSMRTRVHGDYHLGQVLVVDADFVIIDFEGEPARSLRERRAKQSPLKDVSGMLRSFSYAAYATLLAASGEDEASLARLAPRARAWDEAVSDAFLDEYRRMTEASGIVPAVGHEFDRLLDAFMLEKAVYELGYELASRPQWIDIPLLGILQVLGAPVET